MRQIIAYKEPVIDVLEVTNHHNIIVRNAKDSGVGIIKKERNGRYRIEWAESNVPTFPYPTLRDLILNYPLCKFYLL
jgi:hypothetical protein